MRKVSIVLLNYNNETDTNKCLDSLTKLDYPDFNVIVVNNGSNEESGKRLRQHIRKLRGKIKVKVVELRKNVGFAGGGNTGTKVANTDLVALLNNDTIVDKNYLKEMVKTMESDDSIAIVGSKIKNVNTYGNTETLGSVLSFTGSPVDANSSDQGFTFIVSGCSMLFNRKIVGIPFDPDYMLYAEDTYVSWLTKLRGYNVRIAPNSKLVHRHLGRQTKKRTPTLAAFHSEKNVIMNILLFFESSNLIKLIPVLTLNILMTLIITTFKGQAHVRLKSYWWIISNFGKIMSKRRRIQFQRKISDRKLAPFFTCKIQYEIGLMGKIINALLLTYCFVVRLPAREIYRKSP